MDIRVDYCGMTSRKFRNFFKMAGVRRKRSQRKKRVNSTATGRKLKKKNKIKISLDSNTIRKSWDKSKTLKQNFKDLGLAYSMKTAMPIKNKENGSGLGDEPMEIDKQPKKSIIPDLEAEASNGVKQEKHISPGEAKFLWELIRDFGDDYTAMAKDKRNYYQHTANQLRRKCVRFLNSSQDFSNYINDKTT